LLFVVRITFSTGWFVTIRVVIYIIIYIVIYIVINIVVDIIIVVVIVARILSAISICALPRACAVGIGFHGTVISFTTSAIILLISTDVGRAARDIRP
jgi:hypothetical protein